MSPVTLTSARALFLNFLLFSFGCLAQPAFDFKHLDSTILSMITNQAVSDEVLMQCIARLGPSAESPEFWSRIANDSSYSIQHRTRAVFALFRRHGQYCGDAASLKKLLGSPKWLEESGIEKVSYVFGKLPVEVNPGESVYRIKVYRRASIYIRCLSNLEDDYLSRLLLHKDAPANTTNPTIIQYAFDDDYEEWLRTGKPSR